jgi:hypothetical protein
VGENAGELTVYGMVSGWVRTVDGGSTKIDFHAVVAGGEYP